MCDCIVCILAARSGNAQREYSQKTYSVEVGLSWSGKNTFHMTDIYVIFQQCTILSNSLFPLATVSEGSMAGIYEFYDQG